MMSYVFLAMMSYVLKPLFFFSPQSLTTTALFISRQGITMYSRLALNSQICCLLLLSAKIKGVYHHIHTWPQLLFKNYIYSFILCEILCMHMHMPWQMCGGQRQLEEISSFLPSCRSRGPNSWSVLAVGHLYPAT